MASIKTEQLEFTRVTVPSSMRSAYWKYFGFPSDSNDTILTRSKIICLLCSTAIAYNKNTTNLRTHLVARHPDTLMEITEARRKKNVKQERSCEDGSEEKVHYDKKPRILSINVPQKIIRQPSPAPSSTSAKMISHMIDEDYVEYDAETYSFDVIDETPNKAISQQTADELIHNMLVKDLLAPSVLDGDGFKKILSELGGAEVRRQEIENTLSKTYSHQFDKVSEYIARKSNSSPYSIGIEILQNIEKKSLLHIYVNYLSMSTNDEPALVTIFFKCIELRQSIDCNRIFHPLNLAMCSAAVVNADNSALENFFVEQNIPIIPCFQTILNRCLNVVFSLPAIESAYEQLSNTFEEHCSTSLEPIPDVSEDHPWTKYNFLKYFHDNVSEKDDGSIERTKQVVDYLTPLKMTLDTLTDEPIPLCSLVKPLTVQLLSEDFWSLYTDLEADSIKSQISDELSISVLDNQYLNEATFFDPRFQNFIDCESVEVVKQNISNRYKELIDTSPTEEKKHIKIEMYANERRSSLKRFFNRCDDIKPTPVKSTQKSLTFEINKYVSESSVDLDQCPILWWKENQLNLKQLKRISDHYACVPCCVTSYFKRPIKEQVDTINRRLMLPKNWANKLWFLHFNKEILDTLA